ncbi:MAG: tripartite tricarboxylate transporter TctB family protein, partial [Deltaproteobacteria bacterium]|nr:tripartite tricarboxylate transporter TctB family protein [Deltaproteobacteria bacterium]
IGLPALLLAIYIFIQESLRSTQKVKLEEFSPQQQPEIDPILARQRALSICGWIVGFFLAIWLLGFTAASAVATFLYLKFSARERWPVAVGLTLAAWLFFYGLFDYGLNMPFPTGAIFEWVPSSIAGLHGGG